MTKISELIRQNNDLAQENASLQYQNLVLKNEVEQAKNKIFLLRLDEPNENQHSQSFDINKKPTANKKPIVLGDSESSLSQRKPQRESMNTYFKTSMAPSKTNFYIENIKVPLTLKPIEPT
jgi:hypothetical protein